jgi:predicted lipoprotein
VIGVTNDEVALALTQSATQPEIVLPTGLLFGNAVRDATGLLDVSDYPNSQDFNGISQALNHIIETRVLPTLRERAEVGATVRFVGCTEIADESTDLKPLRVVPIQIEFISAP